MTIEETLVAKIRTVSAITDVIGDKIYPSEMPSGVNAPAIIYMITNDDPVHTQTGVCIRETNILMQCLSRNYGEARQLQQDLQIALNGYDNQDNIIITRSMGVRGSEYEKDTQYHSIVLEFKVLNK